MATWYNVRLGISPINWINDDMNDLGDFYELETVLSDMRSLGFSGTEMGRKYPRDPGRLKALLARYGLVLTGAWKTVQFSTSSDPEQELAEFQVHVQFLKQMGAQHAVVCEGGGSLHWDARGHRRQVEKWDDEAWMRVAAGLNRAGEYARRHGVRLVYHPHFGTNVETPEEIDRLMALTDPEVVWLLADTGHIRAGGGDPVQVIEKHISRVGYLHLKDVRPEVLHVVRKEGHSFLDGVRMGMFTVPGDGCIDFGTVFDVLRKHGYQGWMILEAEQDPVKADPVVYARKAKALIQQWMEGVAEVSEKQ